MGVSVAEDIDVRDISPTAWRLLRVAAGFGQREVESEVNDIMQAHISMLESDTRSLSEARLEELFSLYRGELADEQVCVLVEHF
jgi:plasmid stability protein